MAARGPSPHRGEGGPKGRMRGASPPWAPSSVSLRSTASPKGEGFGPPRAAAPTDNAPGLPPGGKVARPEAVTDEGTTYGAFPVNGIPQSPPCGGDSPLSQGGRARMVRPTYNRRTLPPVGRFHTFIGNRAVLRSFPDTKNGNAIRTVKTADRAVSYHRGAFSPLRAGG